MKCNGLVLGMGSEVAEGREIYVGGKSRERPKQKKQADRLDVKRTQVNTCAICGFPYLVYHWLCGKLVIFICGIVTFVDWLKLWYHFSNFFETKVNIDHALLTCAKIQTGQQCILSGHLYLVKSIGIKRSKANICWCSEMVNAVKKATWECKFNITTTKYMQDKTKSL